VTVPNVLQRLFTFAKATGASPLENFTIAALAAAIRSEPAPFLDVLHRVSPIPGDSRIPHGVATQVQVRGGVVDLEVVLEGATYWIEVKAHAGEHGHQIRNYQAAAERDPRHPKLVMLCKRRLRPDLATMRWNDLRDAMANSADLRWQDLKQFVEKNSMADSFDEPINLDEFVAAKTTRALLGKMARIAREVLEVQPITKTIDFPRSDANVASEIVQQFRRHGRFVLASKTYPAVFFGLIPKDSGAQLAVWVEFRRTDFDGRGKVFAVADKEGGLGETWTRRREGWSRLLATMDIEGTLEQDVAVTWIGDRIQELDRAGVLRAALALRGGVDPEQS
jgi:hypothetical protein